MKRILIAVSVVFGLAGCATGGGYYRENTSLQQAEFDHRECAYQGELATAGIPSMVRSAMESRNLRDMCLEVRGYRWVNPAQAQRIMADRVAEAPRGQACWSETKACPVVTTTCGVAPDFAPCR